MRGRVVIGLDCGEVFFLQPYAGYQEVVDRVNERINETQHGLMHFVTERGSVSMNPGAINYILEETDDHH